MTPEMKSMILDLHQIGAIQFGSFTLKSGMESPIYIDLRLTISYPGILKKISKALCTLMSSLTFDLICGAPYAAIPLATAIALESDTPMVMVRKEIKAYGTKKMVEGVYQKGQSCILIEDVITKGLSVLETAKQLQLEGLVIEDVVSVLNREQGGKEKLGEEGIFLHSLFSIFDLLKVLFAEKKISKELFCSVNDFLATPAS